MHAWTRLVQTMMYESPAKSCPYMSAGCGTGSKSTMSKTSTFGSVIMVAWVGLGACTFIVCASLAEESVGGREAILRPGGAWPIGATDLGSCHHLKLALKMGVSAPSLTTVMRVVFASRPSSSMYRMPHFIAFFLSVDATAVPTHT